MKKIFITGGARGIGWETAKLFYSRGWKVGIFDNDDSTFQDINSQYPNIEVYHGSVLNPVEITRALKKYAEDGSIDVLHNNAGIILVGEFDQLGLDESHRVVDINLKGVINSTYCALPYLKKAQEAVVINMCSASAIYGNPELTVYAATKAAVKSLTEGWNVAFQKYGIRVCDIIPIYVRTRMVDENFNKFSNLGPKKVKLTPEIIAKNVWKAANGSKIHYLVGTDTKIFNFLIRFIPQRIIPSVLRAILGYNK